MALGLRRDRRVRGAPRGLVRARPGRAAHRLVRRHGLRFDLRRLRSRRVRRHRRVGDRDRRTGDDPAERRARPRALLRPDLVAGRSGGRALPHRLLAGQRLRCRCARRPLPCCAARVAGALSGTCARVARGRRGWSLRASRDRRHSAAARGTPRQAAHGAGGDPCLQSSGSSSQPSSSSSTSACSRSSRSRAGLPVQARYAAADTARDPAGTSPHPGCEPGDVGVAYAWSTAATIDPLPEGTNFFPASSTTFAPPSRPSTYSCSAGIEGEIGTRLADLLTK